MEPKLTIKKTGIVKELTHRMTPVEIDAQSIAPRNFALTVKQSILKSASWDAQHNIFDIPPATQKAADRALNAYNKRQQERIAKDVHMKGQAPMGEWETAVAELMGPLEQCCKRLTNLHDDAAIRSIFDITYPRLPEWGPHHLCALMKLRGQGRIVNVPGVTAGYKYVPRSSAMTSTCDIVCWLYLPWFIN